MTEVPLRYSTVGMEVLFSAITATAHRDDLDASR